MSVDDERTLRERLAAEQDERRRLAELIHDGPVQHVAALIQMLEAVSQAAAADDAEAVASVLERAVEVAREASADLRELVEGIDPGALQEGFESAIRRLAERLATRRGVEVILDLSAGEHLGETARIGLYQIVREALDQAVRRGPPTRVQIDLIRTSTGGAELVVFDDGGAERRSAVVDGLAERAHSLNGTVTLDRADDGTTLRVAVPPVAAGR